MRGHIRKRSKGSWEIVIDLGRDSTSGKRRQHWETVKGSKREADKRLAELLLNHENGTQTDYRNLTFGAWLEEWFQNHVVSRCALSTIDSYQMEIRTHIIPALGNIKLNALRPQDLQSHYRHELSKGRTDGKGGLSPTTVLYQHRIISEALKHAVRTGLIGTNVAGNVDPPRRNRPEMVVMSPEDVSRFLEYATSSPYYAIYYTAIYTGMRLGEILGLQWRNVDLAEGVISITRSMFRRQRVTHFLIPKTPSSRRQISMSSSLVELLEKHLLKEQANRALLGTHLNADDLVFAYPDGNPYDSSTISQHFGKLLSEAGLRHMRFHDLRHTHASLLLRADVHAKVVSERLGHSSVAFTHHGHIRACTTGATGGSRRETGPAD